MNAMKRFLLTSIFLMLTPPAFAVTPRSQGPRQGRSGGSPRPVDRYALRCQGPSSERGIAPVGAALWGTKRSWGSGKTDSGRSVLVSVDTEPLRLPDVEVTSVQVEKGRLLATPKTPGNVVGVVLRGTSSDGKPVEVAICGAEPAPGDPSMHWYRIEAWNPVTREWENPCVANATTPDPRALAVQGVWDESGARREVPGKVTLACETGAISKCISWGYKPWGQRNGKSLVDLHQACTRMARADYCGNGRTHTPEQGLIDMYDQFGVQSRTKESSATWNVARASAPDGAACLARTRDGRALTALFKECPGRFRGGAEVELGDGDRCSLRREGMNPQMVLLRNRSYAPGRSPSPFTLEEQTL